MLRIQNKIAWGLVGALCLLVVAALAGVAQGGPLDPPAAPAPTQRTQITQADMPYTISSPGSYVVMENLTGTSGQSGITISADDVTLDLNGFALIGVSGSLNGVNAPSFSNIAIYNGTVRDWGWAGIWLAGTYGNELRGLRVSNNGGDGLVTGTAAVVTDVTARWNAGEGLSIGSYSVVTGVAAANNAFVGIYLKAGNILSNCTAAENNGTGIYLGDNGNTVTNCTSTLNAAHGIEVSSDNYIMGNTVGLNQGQGIYVLSGRDNRIEGNQALQNVTGIVVGAAGNLIIKNSASSNGVGDYNIAAGNTVGPILGVADPIASTNPWANFSY